MATLLFAILEFPLEKKADTNQNFKTTVSTHVPNYPDYATVKHLMANFCSILEKINNV